MPQHTGSGFRRKGRWGENLGAVIGYNLAGSIAPDLSHACAFQRPRAYRFSGLLKISEVVSRRRGSNSARQVFEENHPRRAEIFAPPHPGPIPSTRCIDARQLFQVE
jgi:hypothetical protein